MAQNLEQLEEELKRQGLPVMTRVEILARAQRADAIADILVAASRLAGRSAKAAARWIQIRVAGAGPEKHTPLRRA